MVIDGIQHRKKSFFNLQGVLLLRLRLLLALIIFLQAITFFSLKTLRKKALVTPLFYFLHHVWLFFFNLSRKTSYKCNTLLFNENVHRSNSIRLPNDRCYLHLSSSKYYFIKLPFFVHFKIVFSSFPP